MLEMKSRLLNIMQIHVEYKHILTLANFTCSHMKMKTKISEPPQINVPQRGAGKFSGSTNWNNLREVILEGTSTNILVSFGRGH